MIVYKITNLLNGKIYVGQTQRTLEERIAEHKYGELYIDRVIKKYGWENFSAEVIEECFSFEMLNEREIFWIAKLKSKFPNGYNLTDGGSGFLGCSHSPESIAKMSEIAKKVWAERTPEERYLIAKKREDNRTFEEKSATAKAREAKKDPAVRKAADKKAGENGIGFYCRKLIWEAYCLDSGICPADCRST